LAANGAKKIQLKYFRAILKAGKNKAHKTKNCLPLGGNKQHNLIMLQKCAVIVILKRYAGVA
jgi:hypothetical protein